MSMIGKTLAHYEITNQLGKGGMGEVFRAKDHKLGREVAIKVLPEEFARDTDRVARFQREAKLLASLNHPNIAAIYGLEASGGTNFLVLELVEGQTLADRIKTGPIPVEESLKLALQIAEALEAAHEKGVIHRDLKPANIKVTPDGKVKVLDFGLAKAYAGEQAELNLSNSPTLSNAATQQGVILGTAAYMSPEQAKGKAVDRRADIWAFGVVLFEMLTGRQVFTGETVSDTLASVLAREPKWQSLPSNLHPRIRLLLERCLKKEPKDRYGVINDARVDIQEVLADPSGVFVKPVTGAEPRTRMRTILPWVAAGVILTAAITGLTVWKLRPQEPRQVARFYYEVPEGQELIEPGPSLAVSPDGRLIVYSTTNGLYLRSVDALNARLITGTEGNTEAPFFSPDGKWIGYYSSDGKLKKIAVGGGAPVPICEARDYRGGSWGADDTIVYGTLQGGIMHISANGGNPESLVKGKSGNMVEPQMLPDGKSFLYTVTNNASSQQRIMVKSLKSGEPKEVLSGWHMGYIQPGYILYWPPNSNNLFAIPFDLNKLEVSGGPFSVIEGVQRAAVSGSGTLVYTPVAPTPAEGAQTLVWVNREGKEEPLAAPANNYAQPKISPDGRRIALAIGPMLNEDIYIWDIIRKTMTRLTFDKSREMVPVWTPDSKRIVYHSQHENATTGGVYWKAADGTGEVEKLCSAPDRTIFPWSLSTDGKSLLMQELISNVHADIGLLSMEGDHVRKLLLHSEYSQAQPEISPDGRWLAYSSTESTGVALKGEVYVRPFPEVDKGKWQISTKGANSPIWSPDGRELFYLDEDGFAMAVSVETKPAISFGTPKVLFKNKYLGLTGSSGTPWDIHPDGKRFLMIKLPEPALSQANAPRPKINIILNWFEELKQRVPVK
jgi:serine/threonine protein kinase/Tol biopolymer transport system component